MRIVFPDTEIIDRGDIDWSGVEALGELTTFSSSTKEEGIQRLQEAGAEAVLIDEYIVDRDVIEACPSLRFIGAAATGYNHIDLEAAAERGIAVCNVPAYSTEAVAQHAMALLLALAGQVMPYDREVRAGCWSQEQGRCYEYHPMLLLEGKSIGIIGYGNIGRKVGELAKAFGMQVHAYSKDPDAVMNADVISLNCPLTEENRGMVNAEFISRMKDGAILINTARGALVDEQALADALKSGKLAGAGVDVTSPEPPFVGSPHAGAASETSSPAVVASETSPQAATLSEISPHAGTLSEASPLLTAPNCIITPHIAFTPVEIRQRVIDVCAANLRSHLDGGTLNRII